MSSIRTFASLLPLLLVACYGGSTPDGPPVDPAPTPDIGKADGAVCPERPDADYVADSPGACAAIRFACEDGDAPFFDACGCGCEPAPAPPSACPDADDPAVRWIEEDGELCARIRFTCEEGETGFSGSCGCGCIADGDACPDPEDPAVSYVSDDPSFCARARFACSPGEEPFTDECGCGCIASHEPPGPIGSATAEEQASIAEKLALDVAAVHDAGRTAFTDLRPYPGDLTLPDPLRALVFEMPFAPGTWLRCQQGNNNVDHEHPQGASHGPDKTLRYSLDLAAEWDEAGLPVAAAAPGRAYVYDGARPIGAGAWDPETSRDNGGLGNFVAIVHGGGFASLYSHLDSIAIENGTAVAAGDVVGAVGRTGAAGVAHLHFHVVPVHRTPTPGTVDATDHFAFAAEYNATFGPSVPFLMRAGRTPDGTGVVEEVVDSRLFESDYYGIDPSAARDELSYWYQAL